MGVMSGHRIALLEAVASETCLAFFTTWIHTQGCEIFKVLCVLSKGGVGAKAIRCREVPSIL